VHLEATRTHPWLLGSPIAAARVTGRIGSPRPSDIVAHRRSGVVVIDRNNHTLHANGVNKVLGIVD
jgi:hypothetical protein